jgi:hypothetical protein
MIDNKKHLTNSKAAKNKRAGQLNRYSTSKLNNRNSNMTNKVSKVNDKVLAKDSKAMKNCIHSIYESILKPNVTRSKENKDSVVILLNALNRDRNVMTKLLQNLGPVFDPIVIKDLIEHIEYKSKFTRYGQDRKVGIRKKAGARIKRIPANAKPLFGTEKFDAAPMKTPK